MEELIDRTEQIIAAASILIAMAIFFSCRIDQKRHAQIKKELDVIIKDVEKLRNTK